VKIVTQKGIQVKEHVSGAGYFSSDAPEMHFGLGKTNLVDSLVVTWSLGQKQIFTQITANQTILVQEDQAILKNWEN